MTMKSPHVPSAKLGEIRNQHIERLVPLLSPQELFEELPLEEAHAEVILKGRRGVEDILRGDDDRLLVVVGPCSVHDEKAALDYAQHLASEATRLEKDLLVVMRVYFEKPRTTVGWKGLINDPHLDGTGDVNTGLRVARKLLLSILAAGVPVGCEFLDPITPQYIADLVSWGAIGARTTESQIHRQLASGLSMAVGFKNRTDGDVQVALDAVRAAAVAHAFPGIDDQGRSALLHTSGNPLGHIILRGGKAGPNYDASSVASATQLLQKAKLQERLIIDVSHDNSHKKYELQPEVSRQVGQQVAEGNQAIRGLMIESFLLEGNQPPGPLDGLTYGQSITDGCIGWDTTLEVLDNLASAVRGRRACKLKLSE